MWDRKSRPLRAWASLWASLTQAVGPPLRWEDFQPGLDYFARLGAQKTKLGYCARWGLKKWARSAAAITVCCVGGRQFDAWSLNRSFGFNYSADWVGTSCNSGTVQARPESSPSETQAYVAERGLVRLSVVEYSRWLRLPRPPFEDCLARIRNGVFEGEIRRAPKAMCLPHVRLGRHTTKWRT